MQVLAIQLEQRLALDDVHPLLVGVELVDPPADFDGHVVETTSNPKDALAKIEQRSYDLVITDFAMPAMRGDELAAAIKSRRPGQPVALITAYAEMLQSTHREMPGVDFVISKPFLLENLREAVAKVTGGEAKGDGAA